MKKELTKLQKKKILYSFLIVVILVSIGVASWLLWGNDNINQQTIVTAITTYAGMGFLAFKIVWFFVTELKNKKARLKEIQELAKEATTMAKAKISKELKSFKKEFTTTSFTFTIEGKHISISINDGISFNSLEAHYKALRFEMGQFIEQYRKYLAGEQ